MFSPKAMLLVALTALPIQVPDQGATQREVSSVLRELESASELWRNGPFDDLWDLDRMLDELSHVLGEPMLEVADSAVLRRGFQAGMRRGLRELKEEFEGSKLELLRIDGGGQAGEVSALARVRDGEGYVYRARFWLSRGEERWRLWDFAEASVNLRYSTILGATLGALDQPGGASGGIEDVLRVVQGLQSLPEGDLDGAYQVLEELDGRSLPPAIERLRVTFEASVLIQDERFEDARALLQSLQEGRDPVHDYFDAVISNRLGEHELALTHARRFCESQVGDGEGLREQGLALSGLGRPEEALAAFAKGLEELPGDPDLLVEFASLLPPERRTELLACYRACRAPAEDFEGIVLVLLERGHEEVVEDLIELQRELVPGDPNADYYAAQLLAERGQHAAAAQLLLAAMQRVEDAWERGFYEASYVESMVETGSELEAYRGLGADGEAFETVAEGLIGEGTAKRLLGLVELHALADPEDAWLEHYRGIALHHSGELQAAEASLLRALETVPVEQRGVVLAWHTRNLMEMGRWRDAYDAHGGTDEITMRLAVEMVSEGAADDLEALVRVHEANESADPEASELAWWRGEVLYLRQEYAQLLIHLAAEREVIVERDLYGWEDRSIRSHLRLGQHEPAGVLAAAVDQRDQDPFYLALVELSAGRLEPARAALERMRALEYVLADLRLDPDFGPLLALPEHAHLLDSFND